MGDEVRGARMTPEHLARSPDHRSRSGPPRGPDTIARQRLLRRGLRLEYVTLSWNVVGVVVLTIGAIAASSVALASFGLDSLVEIGASTVVIWELTGTGARRERLALQLIGWGFFAIVAYIATQATYLLVVADHPGHSDLGIAWTAASLVAMLALAYGKAATGKALENPVLRTEGRVTLVDAYLAGAVLVGLVLNAAAGLWWADPAAGYAIVFYGIREGRAALREAREH